MVLPSGLHDGLRSAAPEVLVRLRVSPFSAGTVKISPCASNAARAPVGEKVDIPDLVGPDRGQMRLKVGQLAVNLDGEGLVGVGRRVDQVNGAKLLVDQAAGAGLNGLEVVALVGHHLADFFAAGVVAEERDGAVAVGEEVDGVARPKPGRSRWSCRAGP